MSLLKTIVTNTLGIAVSVNPDNTEMNNVTVVTGEGNDTVATTGSNNKIDLGSDNDIAYLVGDNNEVKGTNGDKQTILKGNNNNVTFDGDGEHTTNITGNNNNYKAGNGDSTAIITGDGNNYKVGDGDLQYAKLEGVNNFVDMGNATTGRALEIKGDGNKMNALDGVTSAKIEGNNNAISFGEGDNDLSIKGDSNSIKGGNGNSNTAIEGNSNNISLGDGEKSVNVKGNNNTYTAGDGISYGKFEGNSNNITFGDGDKSLYITGDSNKLSSGDGLVYGEFKGNSNDITLGEGDKSLYLTGDNNKLTSGDGQTYAEFKGNSNDLTLGNGDKTIYLTGDSNKLSSGDGEIYAEFKGNSNDITLGDGNKTVVAEGNKNNMNLGNGDIYMTLVGDENNLVFGDGNNSLGFVGNKNNVTMGNGDNFIALWGDSNSIKAGNGNNNVLSLDLAIKSGYFTELNDAWEATLPTHLWDDWVLIDVDKKVKSKCGGLKKKVTITYTYRVDTYRRYSVNGPTNTKIELGNGNNTVTLTGDAGNRNKVTAGTGVNKITNSAKWYWDEFVSSRIEKKSQSKTSWNWSGIVTLGLAAVGSLLVPGLGGLIAATFITDTLLTGITGKPLITKAIGKTVGLVSKKAGEDFELFSQGFKENKFVKVGTQVVTIAAAVVATIVTCGAAAPAIAGALGITGAVATAGVTAAVGAGVGALTSAASATIMAGANGQQISARALAAALAGGAVGGFAGGLTGAGVGALVGTSSAAGLATTAASAGFVGGISGSAANQLVMNEGFNAREMWKAGAIGAASAVGLSAVQQGWTAGKNAFQNSISEGKGYWSSLGDGLATGGRTALNIATGGLTDNLGSNLFGYKNIEKINAENTIKVTEKELTTLEQDIRNYENSANFDSNSDYYKELFAQKAELTQKLNLNKTILNQEVEYGKAQLNKVSSELNAAMEERNLYGQSGYVNGEKYDLMNQNIQNLTQQQNAWQNYVNEAQTGAISLGTKYNAFSSISNPFAGATNATFNGTILNAPMNAVSNTVWNTGELAYNSAKWAGGKIWDGATWVGGKIADAGIATWNGLKWVGNQIVDAGNATWDGIKWVGKQIANGTTATKNWLGDKFTAGKDTVKGWFNSDKTNTQTPSANNQQTPSNEKTWYEKIGDWFKPSEAQLDAKLKLENAQKLYNDADNAYKTDMNDMTYSEFVKANDNLQIAQQNYDKLYGSSFLNRVSEIGQSGLNFLNNTSTTFVRNVLDFTGIKSAYETVGQVGKFLSDNHYGWGKNLEYTIGNAFSSENNYGLNALWKFSGGQSLMGAVNDTWGYLTGSKLTTTNSAFVGNNASSPITSTLKGDLSALFGINSIAPTNLKASDNILQKIAKGVSNFGGKLSNIMNNSSSIFGKVLSFTPIKGTVNMIGSGMKLVMGNDYGWGENLNYTLPGLCETTAENGLLSGLKYTTNGAWDLSGAKAFYELGDKALLYSTDNSYSLPNKLGDFNLSDINALENTVWTDGTKIYNNGSEMLSNGYNKISGYYETGSNWISKQWNSLDFSLPSFESNPQTPVNKVSAPVTKPITTVNPITTTQASNGNWFTNGLSAIGTKIGNGYNAINTYTDNTLSAINTHMSNNYQTVTPNHISMGAIGALGGQVYKSSKIISDNKTDLSKLSVR